jgi:predicted O-methyltransferase YrrM
VVTTIKPELVVETGTFSGISTLWIAEGLKANGRGRVITCELDARVYETPRRALPPPASPNGSNYATSPAST